MSLMQQVLRAQAPAPSRPATRIAVLAGAGGALGSAVLEQALAVGGFSQVRALVSSPVAAAMRGFQSQTLADMARRHVPVPDTGFVVFDRERHANGREAAFLRPEPGSLPGLAQALREAGVRRLVVVLPHAPALLPQALKQGLASLDEHAVAALDFEQVVFVRSAQAPHDGGRAGLAWPAKLARGLFASLSWMVPQQEQPVRAIKVAGFVARLARRLPQAAPGTRVVPPELVWQAAQGGDTDALIDRWLLGKGTQAPAPASRGVGAG